MTEPSEEVKEVERRYEKALDDMEKYYKDVLEQIRDEIERLHYHPKLDFIKNDEVVEMALDIIDKYREEQTE